MEELILPIVHSPFKPVETVNLGGLFDFALLIVAPRIGNSRINSGLLTPPPQGS